MDARKLVASLFLSASFFAGLTGCGKETVNALPPSITALTPVNGAVAVPINQVLAVTFNSAMNPATLNATTFTLTGPGNAAVSGTVAYTPTGSIAAFTPSSSLAYNTLYTASITTGAANTIGIQTSTLFAWSFTTTTQPAVLTALPANGATGVPLNQTITATFSKPMNCATLSSPATNFKVTGPGTTTVAGNVACSGSTATFTPSGLLATNTLYTATITTAATDLAGNPLAANYVWTFRTAPAVTLPTVTFTTPANGSTSAAINQAITATFSVAMNPATITLPTTFTLKAPGGVAVPGTITYVAAGSIATFTPTSSLLASTLYTATITTGATDLAANALAANYVWTFTTAAAADTTKPTVLSTIPLNGATSVPLNLNVSATFSKPMNAATINSTTFTLTGPGSTPVAGLVVYASVGNTATFDPTANLAASTLYTATITTTAADLAGNTLAVNYVWTFTTSAALDTTAPLIVSTNPVNGATAVALNQSINATFTEAMNPLTVTTATYTIVGPGSASVVGTVTYDPINFIATFTPTANFTAASIYTATISNGATDLAGNPLGTTGAPDPWSFTTGTPVLPSPINLGTAALFGDFGGSAGMTNSGSLTVVNGNIGTTAVSTKVVNFHDTAVGCSYTETPINTGGFVNGLIYTAAPPPTVACPNEGTAATAAIAAQAAADALSAYNALVAFPNGLDVSVCPGCGGGGAGELGNRVLAPGIYKSAPGYFNLTLGDLTLDAQGNPNAVWVFQMASYLTVGTPTAHRSVLLVNGALAKNVFWQVGSFATINGILGGGTMSGTIIAQAGASVSTVGVAAVTTVNGRVLSLGPSVTIVNTVINVPAP
ncbi:MAG: Ig-like domain-containing protein [Acidobacteriaceae bacterium]|nr:Ig-like domain-containing protein [Acidobacteriaceae bacterium]